MRKKISLQLIIGFAGIVFITVLIVGLVFIGLYRQAAFETKKEDMLNRARNIAPIVEVYLLDGTAARGMNGFFRFMDVMNDAQLWILDGNGNVITLPSSGSGPGMQSGTTHKESIASGSFQQTVKEKEMMALVLSGSEQISENFSEGFGETTFSVGVPIQSSNGEVIGAVFLHAPVKEVTTGLGKAYKILILGLAIGLLSATTLGIGYSLYFSKPLKKMNDLAHAMANGDYQVRTDIKREDEFGQLGVALDHLAVSLAKSSEESKKLEQVRKDFVANVSHEFRTPLTVIRGSTEALLDGAVTTNEEKDKRLHAILAETSGMNRLVGDLLELSKLESGKTAFEFEPVWISEVLDDIWRSLTPLAAAKKVALAREINAEMSPLHADYGRLRQLLLIFFDNALKHSPENSTVTIAVRQTEGRIIIHIDDEGSGIAEEDLPHIWERFYTADKARNHGTGLGLSIAKQITEQMSGTVEIERLPIKGTRVKLCLPISLFIKEQH